MSVPITEEWRVSADRYQFILERKHIAEKKTTGEQYETWKPHGYYGTVPQLCTALANVVARRELESANGISDLVAAYTAAVESLLIRCEPMQAMAL